RSLHSPTHRAAVKDAGGVRPTGPLSSAVRQPMPTITWRSMTPGIARQGRREPNTGALLRPFPRQLPDLRESDIGILRLVMSKSVVRQAVVRAIAGLDCGTDAGTPTSGMAAGCLAAILPRPEVHTSRCEF